MAAKTPTTAKPRPLYRSVLAPALADEEPEDEDEDEDEELDAVLLLLADAEEEVLLVVLFPPSTASQISAMTLLVAVIFFLR